MSGGEARVWAFSLLFSLAVHGGLMWRMQTDVADAGRGQPSPTVTRVRFDSTRLHTSRMRAVAEAPPTPRRRPPAEKGPAVAEIPVPKDEQASTEDAESVAAAPLSGSEAAQMPTPGAVSLAEVKRFYHSQLLAHIERGKFYPEAARRRGVTGGVKVKFMVVSGGAAASLACSDGPSVLNRAACEAVNRAVPLPEPPQGLMFPFSVSFVMEFALK